ncbi:MAG TPA: hypothetical protein VIL85_20565 [Thermomicrobiales bacterium]|jgi:hypothetical protein
MLRRNSPAPEITVLDSGGGDGLTFAGACEALGVSSGELTTLREAGLVACLRRKGRQIYPRAALDLTRILLSLGAERDWDTATLCWYADLVFAAEVGRTILLPSLSLGGDTREGVGALDPPGSWLETGHVAAVLRDLGPDGLDHEEVDELILGTLRSLIAIALGPDGHWPDAVALRGSALFPIVDWFERGRTPVLGQAGAIARDAPQAFMALVLAFTTIAPPLSKELGQLVRVTHAKLKGGLLAVGESVIPASEQAMIGNETLVAVDKVYAAKATEIHSPPAAWDFQVGVVTAQKRTVALQMKLPSELPQQTIDNIIDLIRPFLGAYGARVVHLLYEIANDPPYWRNPLITVETNDVLDRLGLTRDKRGVHYSRNRETLRNVLNTAHGLEIVGEYTTWEGGVKVRKAMRKSVLSLIGATFDDGENSGLSTEELFQRGLPKTMQIRLNFYEGVRRPDGRLGNQYVLMPRLVEPKKLSKASHSATHELLRAYLLFRYRQTRMKSHTLTVTRQTAMEKANITNKNPRQATLTLRKALDKLVANGTIEGYSATLPAKPHETFEAILSPSAVHNLPASGEEE